jgi:hypothetical protein
MKILSVAQFSNQTEPKTESQKMIERFDAILNEKTFYEKTQLNISLKERNKDLKFKLLDEMDYRKREIIKKKIQINELKIQINNLDS